MQRNLYVIKWPEGHRLSDLTVKLRGLSFKDLRKVQQFKGVETDGLDAKGIDEVFKVVSKRLVWWSLTDEDGNPVPTDAETLADEDFGMMMEILNAWTKAVTGVSAPLGAPSTSGKPFPEESIPTETL